MTIAVIAAAAAAAAGCSNSQPAVNREGHPGTATATTQDGVQQLTVTTGSDFRFHPSTVVVHPGPVVIHLINNGAGEPHNWTLPVVNAATALVGPAQQGTVRFTAPGPGRYQVVCTIHVRQGQTGTLVVVPG